MAELATARYERMRPKPAEPRARLTLALSLLGFDYLFLAQQGALGLASARDAHRFMEFALAGMVAAWLRGRYRAERIAADEAAKEARRIGELQERLVAVVAHDLSDPLTAVRACLDIMRSRAPLVRNTSVRSPVARAATGFKADDGNSPCGGAILQVRPCGSFRSPEFGAAPLATKF